MIHKLELNELELSNMIYALECTIKEDERLEIITDGLKKLRDELKEKRKSSSAAG